MSKKKEADYMKPDSIILSILGIFIRGIAIVVIAYFLYQGVTKSYNYGYRIFAEPPVSSGEGRTFTVTITKDMSPFEMGALLEQKGLVRDGKLFGLQYYCSEYQKDVKPGTFELSTAMTAEEMFAVMATPEPSKESEEEEDTYDYSETVTTTYDEETDSLDEDLAPEE